MATLTKPKLQPTSSGEDEQRMLSDLQIEFKLVEIRFDDIDIEGSKHNQARFLALHEDVVLGYAAAMEQGDIFPPIIVTGSKGRYFVLDGNHRIAAAQMNDFTHTTAIVCRDVSKGQAELITYQANARHGLPTGADERLEQAVYLVNSGNSPKVVARALAIPEQRLYRSLQSKRSQERITKLGYDPKKLPPSSLSRVAAIQSNVVLQPVVDLITKAMLDTTEINEIVTAVNGVASGEAAQLKVVEDYRNRYSGRIRSTMGGKMPLPGNLSRIHQIARMTRNLSVEQTAVEIRQMDAGQQQLTRREVFESIAHLLAVSEAIKDG